MTAAGAEAVCFEIPACHHAESDRSLYARVSRRDKGRPMCLTRFAALVSLLLSCAVLLLNAYHHKAADYQHTSAGGDSMGSVQQKQQQIGNNPSAHLTAPDSFNHSKRVYLEWEYNLGLAHLIGFKYQDGDLIVLKDGMYKVYLQITFRRPGHFVCSEEDSVFILTQKVILFAKSYHKNRDLLTASDTVDCIPKSNDCQPPGSEGSGTQYWEKSPCTSGVFALKAGDRLRVRLGDRYHELMLLQEDRTFFGAHLI
ncbi:tumor necrosis factor ligand superfamily member 15 [Coregonus clupeaformis]|uniref:tumor necrosis factor ligand superfamily member 15 n=1 Tax=Coregonus clupeaformis TaxID=59861 RepID=UPI001BE06C9E|nr:tumor necrosis factor ligand superfamily member 15 [Coregonus clupeaformis]